MNLQTTRPRDFGRGVLETSNDLRLLFLGMVILFGADHSAANDFEKVIGGLDADRGVFVTPTKDGGYIAVGVTKSFGEGDEDVYLVRTDASRLLSRMTVATCWLARRIARALEIGMPIS